MSRLGPATSPRGRGGILPRRPGHARKAAPPTHRAGGRGLAVPPGHGRDSERAPRFDWFGLSRTDSVPNPARRLQTQLTSQPQSLNDFPKILQRATTQDVDHRPRTLTNPKAKSRPGRAGNNNQRLKLRRALRRDEGKVGRKTANRQWPTSTRNSCSQSVVKCWLFMLRAMAHSRLTPEAA